MSLHCPARVFLARHGLAEYESELVTDDGGSLTPAGREQARLLAQSLRGEKIARVWASPLSRAVQTAEIAAAALGVDVVVREGLREYGVGALAGTDTDETSEIGPLFRAWAAGDDSVTIRGGERIADVVGRVTAVLDEVADEHRGEAVLVVSHGGAILSAVPVIAGLPRLSAYDRELVGGGFVEMESDADGWRIIRWSVPPT